MNKIELKNLDVEIYNKTLSNGLDVYIVPKNDVNNIYATFTTKYGSNIIEYECNKKMVKLPLGIAHFLEHKMFETKDGKDVFEYFGSRGTDCNANTNNLKTTYLFSGTEFFEENLRFLLDFVQEPYFTDDNVEKEKGIIIQEINMYKDNPFSKLYEKCYDVVFKVNPYKYPVIGNEEEVNSVTKQKLYECYNTFYHPSNMFLVIVGNIDPKATIKMIEDNQSKKEFADKPIVKLKKYNEPDEIEEKEVRITANIEIPKIAIIFKINLNNMDISDRKKNTYLSLFFDIKFGPTSLINEKLREEKVIFNPINNMVSNHTTHTLAFLFAETDKIDEYKNSIINEIKNINIDIEEFKRKKKTMLSSLVYMSDNIFRINSKIMNNIILYNKINDDDIKYIKDLSYDEFTKFISNIDFNNYTVVIEEKK